MKKFIFLVFLLSFPCFVVASNDLIMEQIRDLHEKLEAFHEGYSPSSDPYALLRQLDLVVAIRVLNQLLSNVPKSETLSFNYNIVCLLDFCIKILLKPNEAGPSRDSFYNWRNCCDKLSALHPLSAHMKAERLNVFRFCFWSKIFLEFLEIVGDLQNPSFKIFSRLLKNSLLEDFEVLVCDTSTNNSSDTFFVWEKFFEEIKSYGYIGGTFDPSSRNSKKEFLILLFWCVLNQIQICLNRQPISLSHSLITQAQSVIDKAMEKYEENI